MHRLSTALCADTRRGRYTRRVGFRVCIGGVAVSVVAAGLIAVVWILLLVTSFLFLARKCQSLPEAKVMGQM